MYGERERRERTREIERERETEREKLRKTERECKAFFRSPVFRDPIPFEDTPHWQLTPPMAAERVT